MTARPRFLGGGTSPPTTPQSPSSTESPPGVEKLDSDFIVILAALLCALICVLGLVAVARCAWIRRIAGGHSPSTSSSSPTAANKGLKKKVLKSLPKLTYGEENGAQSARLTDCAICLAEFASGDEVRVLPQCGHGFHVICIDTWLGSHSSCPSCRRILVVARCQKCGQLPSASCSTSRPPPPPPPPEPRENHVNIFLP